MSDVLTDARVLAALNYRPPSSPSHDVLCGGECGPCGGMGGIEAMTCLTCGGSGKCTGCGFGEGYRAGAAELYSAVKAALSPGERERVPSPSETLEHSSEDVH